MRTLPCSLALALTLATGGLAVAEPGARTLGVDGGLAMPTGDWGDAAGVGIGALARFEMPLQPKLTLTARAGYLQHLSKEANGADSSTSELPLLGGVRYAFSGDEVTQVYGAAELGFIMSRISIDAGGQSMSDSDTNLGMTLGGGYRTGKLDLRANLLFPDVGELGDVMGLMARSDITSRRCDRVRGQPTDMLSDSSSVSGPEHTQARAGAGLRVLRQTRARWPVATIPDRSSRGPADAHAQRRDSARSARSSGARCGPRAGCAGRGS